MQEAHTVSHFQKAVLKIVNYLIILAVALLAVIIAVAIFRGDGLLTTLQLALVLTVAAIPVAMPTVLSVTMAVGVRLLAKKEAQDLTTYLVLHFMPFDAVHKRTEATVNTADGKTFKVTKGAPQVILALSANAGGVKSSVGKAVNEFAVRGFRSLDAARAGRSREAHPSPGMLGRRIGSRGTFVTCA